MKPINKFPTMAPISDLSVTGMILDEFKNDIEKLFDVEEEDGFYLLQEFQEGVFIDMIEGEPVKNSINNVEL